MDFREKREWIEVGKMVNNFMEVGLNLTIEVGDTYGVIKKYYFKDCLKIEESVEIPCEVPYKLMDALYEKADEMNITIDEVLMEILEKYFEPKTICDEEPVKFLCEKGYRFLSIGEMLKEGDEYFSIRDEWVTLDECYWDITYPEYWSCQIRRKIETPVYRLLNDGEVCVEGDEIYDVSKYEWRVLEHSAGSVFDEFMVHLVRRKM